MVQSHEILIGRGVSWRSLRRHDLQPLEFAIVVVRGIRDHLVEQHMDGGDDLVQFWDVDLVATIIFGIAGVESGVGLVVEVLSTGSFGL